MRNLFVIMLLVWVFAGCSDNPQKAVVETDKPVYNSVFQAQLGPISGATVKTYKIQNNGSKVLLYTETTSTGSSFEDIGYFTSYRDEFEDDSFYLYEISGGVDIDADDDGLIDTTPTTNNGTIHLLAKGSSFKNTDQQIRATVLSEMAYTSVSSLLKSDIASLESQLNDLAKSLFSADINGDGKIDYIDILTYNPVSNQGSLKAQYSQSKLTGIISKIHNNDLTYIVDTLESLVTKYTVSDVDSLIVSADEKTVFISSDNGLEKLDISDLSNIIEIDHRASLDGARELLLSTDESTLFVAYNTSVKVIDTASMDTLSSYAYSGDVDFMALSHDGTLLYVGESSSSVISVFIIANANELILLREITGSIGSAEDITLSSDSSKLLVADYDDGFVYFDVSGIKSSAAVELYHSNLLSPRARKISFSADDNYAYLVNGSTDRLVIYDLENQISLGGTYISGAKDIDLSKDGKHLYITNGHNLLKVDVSDPNQPAIVSSVLTTANEDIVQTQINADASLAYMATVDGLEVVSLSTSANNTFRKAHVTTGIYNRCFSLSTDENYAYIGHSDGLSIYNLQTNTYTYEETASTGVFDITLDEDNSKVFVRKNNQIDGYTISDKSNPAPLAANNSIGSRYGLSLSAYKRKVFSVSIGATNTLYVLNSTRLNSTDDALSEKINTSSRPYDVISSYDDSTVFVAMKSGLGIYSYTNYQNMRADNFILLDEETSFSNLTSLAYNEDKALLFAGTINGLVVYDVSDETNISVIATYGSYAADIQMSNDKSKLYIPNNSDISVLDISDISNIHEVFTFLATSDVRSVKESTDSKTLYVLTAGSLIEYDLGFLYDLRAEVTPVAQDLNITSSTRFANITLLGSDADSDDANLSYIITKEAVVSGKDSYKPTLSCIGSNCMLTPHSDDRQYKNYRFSYKVFDGTHYSNEATVNVQVGEFFGFDTIREGVDIEVPNTQGSKNLTVINNASEAYTITTNTNAKTQITTEVISATKLKVTVDVLDTSRDFNYILEVTVHSLDSDQNSTKQVDISYDDISPI